MRLPQCHFLDKSSDMVLEDVTELWVEQYLMTFGYIPASYLHLSPIPLSQFHTLVSVPYPSLSSIPWKAETSSEQCDGQKIYVGWHSITLSYHAGTRTYIVPKVEQAGLKIVLHVCTVVLCHTCTVACKTYQLYSYVFPLMVKRTVKWLSLHTTHMEKTGSL